MDYVSYYRQSPKQSGDSITLDSKASDVNGDGVSDDVYLIGSKTQGLAIDNIRIVIRDGKTKQSTNIELNVNKGYEPKLFLGRFTNKRVDDILVTIQSGNTGREGYFYIYSFFNNKVEKLFDFEEFNKTSKYDVIYKDKYIVNIIGKNNDKQFVVDIRNKNSDYLSMLYRNDGILKKAYTGQVSSIIELHPVVSESDNGYDLYAIQRVVGYYNADTLGMIVTPLRWNKNAFAVINNNPYLTLFGTDTTKK